MYEEVFEGMNYTNEEIADMFNKTFALDRLEEASENVECKSQNGTSDMVVVKDIELFSYCEHHLALMYDMKVTVAYIPKGRVIGLSKIARIADMVSKKIAASGKNRKRYCRYYADGYWSRRYSSTY